MVEKETDPKGLRIEMMVLLSLAVGVIAGFGAVVFRLMIGLFHNLMFLGEFSFTYDANVHTPISVWGMAIILVPIVGALGVAFLTQTFAPEARGHGVPEVMDAIYYNGGKIRPVVVVIKAVASALSIGSGGSVGREGPIIQIGAAFGSLLGQWIRMTQGQRVSLLAAGAAGGIAATFNTPIGGVAFALELMLPAIHAGTLLPVVIGAAIATYIGRLFLGLSPAFDIPQLADSASQFGSASNIITMVAFGLLIGAAASLFTRSIYWFEDAFDRMPGNAYSRHMIGMAIVGICFFLLMKFEGHYFVQGVGYATIEDTLRGDLNFPALLLLLCLLKLFVTSLTLGSGASGGVFSPALFMGATLGTCVGLFADKFIPGLTLSPEVFAIAGMAGMIAGSTGAVLTGIVMLFEMTRDYSAILPIIMTSGFAAATRRYLCPGSIYTLKLMRRGHVVPEGLQAAIMPARLARHVMDREFTSGSTVPDHTSETAGKETRWFVAAKDGAVTGVYRSSSREAISPNATDGGRWTGPMTHVCCDEDQPLNQVLEEMAAKDACVALISSGKTDNAAGVVGLIDESEIVKILCRDNMVRR